MIIYIDRMASTKKLENMSKAELLKYVKDMENDRALDKAFFQNKIKELEKKIEDLANFNGRMISVEKRVAAAEQYSRRECVEIVGLDVTGNVEEKVVNLFNKAQVNVTKRDFHAIHTLHDKKTVIAKLVNRRDAIAILRRKKVLRELSAVEKREFGVLPASKCSVNESLCAPYRRLQGVANRLLKKKIIEGFYSLNGNLKIKKLDGQIFTYSHVDDLKKEFGDDTIQNIIVGFNSTRKQ